MFLSVFIAFWTLACLLAGVAIGYSLSRKQQDKPVIERTPAPTISEPETVLSDPFQRAMFTEEEQRDMLHKRIPTIME